MALNPEDNQLAQGEYANAVTSAINPHRNRTVDEWIVATEQEEVDICIDIAGRIELGTLKYREVLQELQPWIVGDDNLPDISRALQLVVELLKTVQTPMNRNDAHVLVQYFCQRLDSTDDNLNHHAGIKETVQALSALASMKENIVFLPEDAILISQAVFSMKPTFLKSQKKSTRQCVYDLLQLLMEKYKAIIVSKIGSDQFVESLVALSLFEGGASCLQNLWGLFKDLVQQWNLNEATYTILWDSFGRYFPIKLDEIAKEPSLIPATEVLKALLECFVSHDFFARLTFPRLVDMLDSTTITAGVKQEIYDTMIFCIARYRTPVVLEWANKLWDSLKFEVWNGENEDFIQGALKVIKAIAYAVSAGAPVWNDDRTEAAIFLDSVLKECVDRIVDSKLRYMSSTGRILYEVASASSYTFCRVVKKSLPALLLLWDDLTYNSEKGSLLGVFNGLLKARLEVEDQPEVLSLFKVKLVEQVYWAAMTSGVSDSPDDTLYRIKTIRGLVLLTRIPGFLLDYEQGTIITTLCEMALNYSSQTDELLEEAVSGLRQVSIYDPARFSAITLPRFIAHLPLDVSDGVTLMEESISEKNRAINVLESLIGIACQEPCISRNANIPNPSHEVFDAFQDNMIKKLSDLLLPGGQPEYAHIVLSAICLGLQAFDAALEKHAVAGTNAAQSQRDTTHHPYAWIVIALFKPVVRVNQDSSGNSYVGVVLEGNRDVNEKLVSIVGDIATLALRSHCTTPANKFLTPASVTESSEVWSLFSKHAITSSQINLRNATADKYLASRLTRSLVAGIKREDKDLLQFKVGDIGQAMMNNTLYSSDDNTPFARVTSLQFLQLLVNKFGAASEKAEGESTTLFEDLKKIVTTCATSSNDSESAKIYQALSYFTAAALARCDKTDKELTALMIEGIKHQNLGRKVAQAFRLLLAPSDTLTKENFCLVRPLRHGRLYNHVVEDLISTWRSNDNEAVRTNALVALAGTLEHMEPAVYLDHAKTLLPLLLEGTHVQDDDGMDSTKLSCILAISRIVPSNSSAIISHLDSVIMRMTDRTRNTYFSPSDSTPKTRAAAIDVLSKIVSKIDHKELLNRKPRVLLELSSATDDSNIMVRQRAVACKLAWSSIVS